MSLDVTARMPNAPGSGGQGAEASAAEGLRLAEELHRAVKDIRAGRDGAKIQVYKVRLDALRFAALMAAGSGDVARGRSIARQVAALARELRSLGEEAVAADPEAAATVVPQQPPAAGEASDALQSAASTMGILRRAQWRRKDGAKGAAGNVDIES